MTSEKPFRNQNIDFLFRTTTVYDWICTLVSNQLCQQQSKGLTTIAKLPSGCADQGKGEEEGHLYAGQGLNGQFEGGTGIIVIILASDNRPNTLHSILKIISLSRCKDKIARSNKTKEDVSSINDTNIPQNTQNNLLSMTIS